jgi:hypothetical protein
MTKSLVPAPFSDSGDQWTYIEADDRWLWACSDEQWQAVLSANPKALLADADLGKARLEFNAIGSDCIALSFFHHKRFAKSSPAKAWRKRLKHIFDAKTGAEKSEFYLENLEAAEKVAKAAIWAFESQGKAHKGRKSPERDWLYERLLKLWTHQLGGKLTTGRANASTMKEGKPVANSPVVRFLLAALTPILGDKMIGAEAAEKIVEAEQKRRRQHTDTVI